VGFVSHLEESATIGLVLVNAKGKQKVGGVLRWNYVEAGKWEKLTEEVAYVGWKLQVGHW
jgi:hypothetical protein